MHKMSNGLLEIHFPEQIDRFVPDHSELVHQIFDLHLTDFPLTMINIHVLIFLGDSGQLTVYIFHIQLFFMLR